MQIPVILFLILSFLVACKDVLYEDNIKMLRSPIILKPTAKNESKPNIMIETDPDLAYYGLKKSKLTIENLSISNPEPYIWLNIVVSSREQEDFDIGFVSSNPEFFVYVQKVWPRDNSSCELETVSDSEKTLHFNQQAYKQIKAFVIEQGKIGKELELRSFNKYRFFTIKPRQDILVQWSYSHEFGDKPYILPAGIWPAISDCEHEGYEEFYKRCYKEKFPLNSLSKCDEYMQMVKSAVIKPFDLSFYALKSGDMRPIDESYFKVEIKNPPMEICY
jgi:hypothetical protein